MSIGDNTRLRASCERCRGQKLRCLPTSDSTPGAPCQRCIKAKTAESCVFIPRSRAPRPARSRASSSDISRCKDSTTETALPGTSVFALTPNPSPDCFEAYQSFTSTPTHGTAQLFNSDEAYAAPPGSTDLVSTYWEANLGGLLAQDSWNESMLMDSDPSSLECSQPAESPIEDPARAETSDSVGSPPKSWPLDGNSIDLESTTDNEQQDGSVDPLLHLTNLLAEMYRYEQQLARLPVKDALEYPVGDALYFSQLFRSILLPTGILSQESAISALSTPTILLVLSCFVTLYRIYTFIFRHFVTSLSQDPSLNQPLNRLAETRSYRGLRLAQLHKVCFCSHGELIKSAALLLLESLGETEDLLEIPVDARATTVRGGSSTASPNSTRGTQNSGESLTTEQGSPFMAKSEVFYHAVGLHAKDLQRQVEQLMDMFKRMSVRAREHCRAL
ncbi:hypothetical protein EJ05DRAFT_502933 [Pseudovirgaria hyperparasitica]|uniref:Zn(2)-C6 fungal-type domain-containing protein n=1 Tax=Pseudovirgaria hyperparasitica TaxID=470096 RepID=A0A6A6W0G0_9PEZI|nr:uncharacterized protein EJ05DRAFT_502933 [Pseudovirgaria hyperparasitica]KAF2755474.1 hypothetical protein EJ05DRAFT_502933 [Pseudovirgaria hyperparasitica]